MKFSRRHFVAAAGGSVVPAVVPPLLFGQETGRPTFRVKVDMVVLSFTVTDSKGRYVNGLGPADFRVLEDGIPQKVNTFTEGNRPPLQILEDGSTRPLETAQADPEKGGISTDAFVGTNV